MLLSSSGTDLVMDRASFPVPTRGTVAVNMSEAELAGLQAKVEHSVSGRLREELLAFKASFHHEVEDEIERHIQKVGAWSVIIQHVHACMHK